MYLSSQKRNYIYVYLLVSFVVTFLQRMRDKKEKGLGWDRFEFSKWDRHVPTTRTNNKQQSPFSFALCICSPKYPDNSQDRTKIIKMGLQLKIIDLLATKKKNLLAQLPRRKNWYCGVQMVNFLIMDGKFDFMSHF